MIEQLPEPILDHINSLVEREYTYRDGSLHVTELLYCLRKSYLRRQETAEKEISQKWYLYRGLIFDELWTTKFSRNQVRITHRIPDGPTIVGKIDFIHEDTIYELKTVSNFYALKDGAKEQHIKQVKFYAWCENLDKAKLIYVSLEGVRIFDIDCSDAYETVRELEEKARILYKALKSKIPPEPVESWECRYCEYKNLCWKEG